MLNNTLHAEELDNQYTVQNHQLSLIFKTNLSSKNHTAIYKI